MFKPYTYALVEYRMDSVEAKLSEVQAELNALGEQGYHVISVDTASNKDHRRMVWTLERAGDPMSGNRI